MIGASDEMVKISGLNIRIGSEFRFLQAVEMHISLCDFIFR